MTESKRERKCRVCRLPVSEQEIINNGLAALYSPAFIARYFKSSKRHQVKHHRDVCLEGDPAFFGEGSEDNAEEALRFDAAFIALAKAVKKRECTADVIAAQKIATGGLSTNKEGFLR